MFQHVQDAMASIVIHLWDQEGVDLGYDFTSLDQLQPLRVMTIPWYCRRDACSDL